MSEDTTSTPDITPKRTKKDELFGFPKDDITLGLAAAGLGLAGLVGGKILWDMAQAGQLPNPFQPANTRVTYSDIYEQQKAQQEWEAQQRAQHQQAQQVQQQPQLETQEQDNVTPGEMPAFTGFDDSDDGVSYSTTVKKPGNRFDRINGG